MSNHTMKGTLFGGFKRSDVTEYIERLSKENMEALTLLREEVENLRRERDDLSSEKDSLVETNALLEAAKEEKAALTEEVVALRAEKLAAEKEIASMREELEKLRPEVQEYHDIKEKLSDIQIEACRRANELEESTKARMQALEDETYERLKTLASGCRSAYDATFVEHYPAVFDEIDALLKREEVVEPHAEGAEEASVTYLF